MKLSNSIHLSVLGLSGVAFFATGCSTSSIVKKPEINQVKRVAIVSVTAHQRVPHKSGRGEVTGWSEANRLAIADLALAEYASEFKKLGWEVLSSTQLVALKSYKDNFAPKLSNAQNSVAKALNTLSTMSAESTYFSPTGHFPIVWEEEKKQPGTLQLDLGSLSLNKVKELKTKMKEVAAEAGVDAAILVQADYCYDDGSFWVGKAGSGTGTAVITGASAIYAVNPNGVEVVKMKRIPSVCGGEPRVASDSSTPMVSGVLLFKDQSIQKMFQEVAQKSASENVKLIQAAIKKP